MNGNCCDFHNLGGQHKWFSIFWISSFVEYKLLPLDFTIRSSLRNRGLYQLHCNSFLDYYFFCVYVSCAILDTSIPSGMMKLMHSHNLANLFVLWMVDLCYQVVHLDIHVEGWKQCRAKDDRDIIYLFILRLLCFFQHWVSLYKGFHCWRYLHD